MYMCTYMYVCACKYVYAYTYIHMYICIYTTYRRVRTRGPSSSNFLFRNFCKHVVASAVAVFEGMFSEYWDSAFLELSWFQT